MENIPQVVTNTTQISLKSIELIIPNPQEKISKIALYEHHEKSRIATIKAHEDFLIAVQAFTSDPNFETMAQKEYELVMSYTFGDENLSECKKSYLVLDIENNGTKEIPISIKGNIAKIDDFQEYYYQPLRIAQTKNMIESIYRSEYDYKIYVNQISSWANFNYPMLESGFPEQNNDKQPVEQTEKKKKSGSGGFFACLCGSSKGKNEDFDYIYEGPRNAAGKRHGTMGKWSCVEKSSQYAYPRKVALYEGSWKNDYKDGLGRQYYNSGHLQYNGYFVYNLFHGEGRLYSDPSAIVNIQPTNAANPFKFLVYHGDFKEGKRYGKGIQYNFEGKIVYDGIWIDDQYNTINKIGTPSILYYDSVNGAPPNIKYQGHFKNGLMHGNDGIFYTNDVTKTVIYQGQFSTGNHHGDGILFYNKKYSDKLNNDEQENEFKQYIEYRGEFYKHKKYGNGILYNQKNGSKLYHGNFKDDQYCGFGKLYLEPETFKAKEVQIYEGNFEKGKYHGKGRLYDANKNSVLIYEGEFKDGEQHGSGKLLMENGKILYEGYQKLGKKEGYGSLYADSTGYLLYVGNFKNDLYDGSGKLYDKDQLLDHEGKFKANKKEGSGISYWQNGYKKFTGGWKNNYLEESGKEYYKENGQLKYKGKFVMGLKSGNGGVEYYINKLDFETGPKKYEGQWLEDKWHGDGKFWDEEKGEMRKMRFKYGKEL